MTKQLIEQKISEDSVLEILRNFKYFKEEKNKEMVDGYKGKTYIIQSNVNEFETLYLIWNLEKKTVNVNLFFSAKLNIFGVFDSKEFSDFAKEEMNFPFM